MNGSELSKVSHEKDLWVVISIDLKSNKHCSDAVKKVNKLVGFIGRSFEDKSVNDIRTLFNALARPHHLKKKKLLINWREYKEKFLRRSLDCETSLTKND